MRRVIGIDLHRTFGEVVVWEEGRLRSLGRVDMTRTALEGLGGRLLSTDEVVIEATGNCMAVSRVLSPFVKRVVIANPLQVKAIAHARVKTDKVDAGTLASLFAAGYLPEIWTPDAQKERKRRLAARRYQIVRHRTRIKNEVHAILHAHLIPKCPHADLFNQRGRAWLGRQDLPDGRARGDRPASARARPAGRGSRHPRSGDRRGCTRRRRGEAADDHHRGQADGRSQPHGGDRRHPPIQPSGKTRELLRAEPACPPVGPGSGPSWPHQQDWTQPCARDAGRGGWAAAKAPGPLHAFFVRIRAKRGHQIAAVAVARIAVLCWHVLTKERDYLWARPALVANKMRALELQAGLPQKKGNQRGPAYAYNIKALRDQELELAQQAERNYARFVERWRTRPPKGEARERLNPARNE